MESFLEQFEERLVFLHEEMKQAIAGLPVVALDWTPQPAMNSMAVLVTHLTGATRFWVGDVAAGEPSGRVRAAEFEVRQRTAVELAARLDETLAYVQTVLPRLQLADLERLCQSPRHDEVFTVGWCLLHALEHTAVHTGHLQLMRQLWQQQADGAA